MRLEGGRSASLENVSSLPLGREGEKEVITLSPDLVPWAREGRQKNQKPVWGHLNPLKQKPGFRLRKGGRLMWAIQNRKSLATMVFSSQQGGEKNRSQLEAPRFQMCA